tara:strand:- start:122 stop:388 length:267 start_codon:yes stop_codon:yes gene_type:complete
VSDAVHVYWRPGCPFCPILRRGLEKRGIATIEHDIWSDEEAAEVVRSFARGNETVPTVVIGDVGFVNPTAGAIEQYLRDHAPNLFLDT